MGSSIRYTGNSKALWPLGLWGRVAAVVFRLERLEGGERDGGEGGGRRRGAELKNMGYRITDEDQKWAKFWIQKV